MSQQPALRNRRVICKVVLMGSYFLVAAITMVLLMSLSMGNVYAVGSLAGCAAAFVYLGVAQMLGRWGRSDAEARLLVIFYLLLATGIVWSWGVDTPIGVLIFALAIVLAGIVLTARCAIRVAIVASLVLAVVQVGVVMGWHIPDMKWSGHSSNFGDVVGYAIVYGMVALISWLYNREMERSLEEAERARAALSQQKATLRKRVKERTSQLRRLQLDEMRQMYRFTELGQLGVTLLHDLANHLTALILEVEGIESREQSEDITRAREIIQYLENIVASTRDRLQGNTHNTTFDLVQKTSELLNFLDFKASKVGVIIDWLPPNGSWMYFGDEVSYGQVVAILVSNAIDAYGPPVEGQGLPGKRTVSVSLKRSRAGVTVSIGDWGGGISRNKLKQLFKPHHSNKKTGLGLGLYIAKQTIEMQFYGTVSADTHDDYTEFVIKLPKKNEK